MKRAKFDVYQAKDGWRWRLVATNGRIIADSGEAYVSKRGAERAVTTTIRAAESVGHGRMIASIKAGAASPKRYAMAQFVSDR
jgi:uncharacterized protein YegP (UPF0339 family)